MTGQPVPGGGMAAPRVNPLQRLWLREIGIEKTWLREPKPQVAEPAPLVPAQEPARVAAREAAAVGRPAQSPAAPAAPARSAAAAPSRAPTAEAGAAAAAARPTPPAARPAPAAARGAATPVAQESAEDRQARLRRIEAADVETLHGMVSGCTACGLCQGRRHAVFGMGAANPRWMVVGEAPGEQEDRQGLPFVGRSGQLLDAMLASVGMSRERDVFIANVIKCRPPGNRNPTPEEVAACAPYLMRQIALFKPERILVLGRFAAQTLLGTDATIGNLRGRVHHVESEGRQIPVVVSYHPAYLLRSPIEKARSWQDLRLAARG
ncbi:uracil-DNA glycosylase [Bordetella genomosp. 13]|nr:uracil-DNA glycosylase [Bordetella genomosp. 13]